jgi:hypothetical protein
MKKVEKGGVGKRRQSIHEAAVRWTHVDEKREKEMRGVARWLPELSLSVCVCV